MTVGEMLRRMSSAEFTEWMAFCAIRRRRVETGFANDDEAIETLFSE
ncbi:hypothetical protein [Nitratidesulfovibrio sp. 1201_IL3209]